jgi:addiction module HigA family antidote
MTRNPKNALPPMHPSELVLKECMPYLDLSAAELAEKIDYPLSKLEEFLTEKRGVDEELAAKLVPICGSTSEMWLRLQQRFDEETA